MVQASSGDVTEIVDPDEIDQGGVTMRLTLANVLELVVAAAPGMALARFVHHENGNRQFIVRSYLN
jgi:hypothetical protein